MRLMKENGLTVRPRRGFIATTDSNHDGPIFPNLAENIVPRKRTFEAGLATSGMQAANYLAFIQLASIRL
jgi:hypothetical protein